MLIFLECPSMILALVFIGKICLCTIPDPVLSKKDVLKAMANTDTYLCMPSWELKMVQEDRLDISLSLEKEVWELLNEAHANGLIGTKMTIYMFDITNNYTNNLTIAALYNSSDKIIDNNLRKKFLLVLLQKILCQNNLPHFYYKDNKNIILGVQCSAYIKSEYIVDIDYLFDNEYDELQLYFEREGLVKYSDTLTTLSSKILAKILYKIFDELFTSVTLIQLRRHIKKLDHYIIFTFIPYKKIRYLEFNAADVHTILNFCYFLKKRCVCNYGKCLINIVSCFKIDVIRICIGKNCASLKIMPKIKPLLSHNKAKLVFRITNPNTEVYKSFVLSSLYLYEQELCINTKYEDDLYPVFSEFSDCFERITIFRLTTINEKILKIIAKNYNDDYLLHTFSITKDFRMGSKTEENKSLNELLSHMARVNKINNLAIDGYTLSIEIVVQLIMSAKIQVLGFKNVKFVIKDPSKKYTIHSIPQTLEKIRIDPIIWNNECIELLMMLHHSNMLGVVVFGKIPAKLLVSSIGKSVFCNANITSLLIKINSTMNLKMRLPNANSLVELRLFFGGEDKRDLEALKELFAIQTFNSLKELRINFKCVLHPNDYSVFLDILTKPSLSALTLVEVGAKPCALNQLIEAKNYFNYRTPLGISVFSANFLHSFYIFDSDFYNLFLPNLTELHVSLSTSKCYSTFINLQFNSKLLLLKCNICDHDPSYSIVNSCFWTKINSSFPNLKILSILNYNITAIYEQVLYNSQLYSNGYIVDVSDKAFDKNYSLFKNNRS